MQSIRKAIVEAVSPHNLLRYPINRGHKAVVAIYRDIAAGRV